MKTETYKIKLPQFEGPFDLLLFFIQRDELDINNIPIAKVTDDFLDYIQDLESIDVDLASEFIVVAASLMRIKAKMLIPRKELDEFGNEIDPRGDLVNSILEYKRFKDVIIELRKLEEINSIKNKRLSAKAELLSIGKTELADMELESLNSYKLLKAFERVMSKFNDKQRIKKIHKILQFSFSVGTQKEHIFDVLKKKSKANFIAIFNECSDRIHAIVTFLALLELLNAEEVKITVGEGYNNFWINKNI